MEWPATVAEIPFIFVSGTIGEDRGRRQRAGATDYVLKDRLNRLIPVIQRALKEARERTARRCAQEALGESEARFRSFMQHLPGRAAIRDLEGRYTYVNESWERACGKPAVDVIGRALANRPPGKPPTSSFKPGRGPRQAGTPCLPTAPVPRRAGASQTFDTTRSGPAVLGMVVFDLPQKQQEKRSPSRS